MAAPPALAAPVDQAAFHGLADRLPPGGRGIHLDPARSRGSWLYDLASGTALLDLCPFYGSAPLGPGADALRADPAFAAALGEVGAVKPANADSPSAPVVELVAAFTRVLGDPELPHLFFVEGGALAVENALKVAFDWKSRHNEANGRSPELGTKVLHLTRAFHGRSGYTMSLTNTDPAKTSRFPTFDWPRIDVPALRFPVDREAASRAERRALDQAEAALSTHPHDIACFIAEPIQGEGGDNHMSPEFLQAMQQLCHDHDVLYVLDEVQTGVGTTGTPWAYQQLGLAPDVVAFGKKLQLGGVMAGRRLSQVDGHVFAVPGRINSTWGGGLVDMVRARYLLDVIERDDLIGNAARTGTWLLAALQSLATAHPVVGNVRGRGLFLAFDLPDAARRDRVIAELRAERVLVLASGERAVRFRPALSVTQEELNFGLAALDRVLRRVS